MIATGLINWDYQRSNHHIVAKSLVIIIPGILLFASTFHPKSSQLLHKRSVQTIWLVIGLVALIYAFIN